MKSSSVFVTIMLIGWGLGVITPLILAQEAEAPQFVMIGHASVPDTLTQDDIKQIFLGRMTRKAGQPLGFVILKDEVVYPAFVKMYLGKTVAQYTNYWKKQVFTGKGRMPKFLEDPAEILTYVAETEGTITFLPIHTTIADPIHMITITE